MFYSIESVRQANAAAGGHWFSREAMSFFGSRIETGLLHGRFFVTSECMEEGKTPRKFTVRAARADGTICDPSGFHRFSDAEDAQAWLQVALAEGIEAADAAYPDPPLQRPSDADRAALTSHPAAAKTRILRAALGAAGNEAREVPLPEPMDVLGIPEVRGPRT